MDSSYPKTLDAVAAYEGGAWPVADALLEEVATYKRGDKTTRGEITEVRIGQIIPGELVRVQTYLAKNGYEVEAKWLSELHAVAEFVSAAPLERNRAELRSFSPRSVLAARSNAKGDHEFALEILAKHGGKLHAITGSDPVGDVRKLTDEQVEGLLDKLSTHKPGAVARTVKTHPKVQAVIATDTETMGDLNQRRIDAAIARHRERHVEPTMQSVLEDSPELRARLKEIGVQTDEFTFVKQAIRVLSEMDEERIAERFIRIGVALDVPASRIDKAINKLSVVRDRLGAAILRTRS